jgi:adenylosuccinate synthase
MAVDVLLGLQWGDEGKGKIVDVLSAGYDLIARFQGGPNAGHTLEFEGKKFVLNTIPSGIFFDNTMNLIGNGVVIDPITLKKELDKLKDAGHDLLAKKNLMIAKKAHLILPTHQLLDAASEKKMGDGKIGSTLKGIGPTYMDKTGRNGLRIGDITLPDFKDRYQKLVDKHTSMLQAMYGEVADFSEREAAFLKRLSTLNNSRWLILNIWLTNILRTAKRYWPKVHKAPCWISTLVRTRLLRHQTLLLPVLVPV